MDPVRLFTNLSFSIAALSLLGHADDALAADTQSTVVSNTAFAFDLYSDLAKTPGNVLFSPYSVSTALAMTYGGARGETAKQMAKALHFNQEQGATDSAFGQLQVQLNQLSRPGNIELSIANALWSQKGHPFLPVFLATAKNNYQANINQADFETGAELARNEINRWVELRTKSKIQDALPAGSIDRATRLVLVNAIYFKGAWLKAFWEEATLSEPFHVSASKNVDCKLMQNTDSVRYLQAQDFQAVELPYKGKDLAMVILLPQKVEGCTNLEKRLSPMFIWRSISLLKEQEVEIFLPRFKIESELDLHATLSKRGIRDAFDPQKADFSGIDGDTDLFISAVFHKAWVEVNEEGTEAAAVTGVPLSSSSAEPQRPPIFRADHPFIFFIRDTRSGNILFLGRLAQPS
jgi:serpin B